MIGWLKNLFQSSTSSPSPPRLSESAESLCFESINPADIQLQQPPLGQGGYGTVYRATINNVEIAAKVINEQNALHMSEEQIKRFEHEVELLRQVRHECIVRFIGASLVPGKYMICLELMSLGSVGARFERRESTPVALRQRFALDLARALAYLHSLPLIFRDVKSDNLLIASLSADAPVCCKLTDFGIARAIESDAAPRQRTSRLGSPPYMAPEMIDEQPYSCSLDMYSYGIVLFELAAEEHAWRDANVWSLPSLVMRGDRPILPPTTPPKWAVLARACWSANPQDRPTALQVLHAL